LIDHNIVLLKAGSVKRHVNRIIEKRNVDLQTFLNDIDRQEIILFNLQMAIQNCIDIAAHIVSEEGLGVPGSISEMFYLLQEKGYIDGELSEKMIKAVGFRNLLVHSYGKVEIRQVYEIIHKHIQDLSKFLITILDRLGISDK